jgi:hypothetical protein
MGWGGVVTALGALTMIGMASTAAATEPAAISWTQPLTIRAADGVKLQDADFSGRHVAVTWQEPGASAPKVRFVTSVNSGDSFVLDVKAAEARQAAVDICGGYGLRGVYAHRVAPGNWVVERVMGSFLPGGGVWEVNDVSPSPLTQRDPDVACAGGRTFVGWIEQGEGPGEQLVVAHELHTGDGGFSDPVSLGGGLDGEFFSSSLTLAGVSDTAYAAFVRSDGRLYVKRWTIGAGPGHAVTGHPATAIGGGSADDPAWSAVIAAAGDKVAVAWIRCNALRFRVSNDRGQTWGPVRYHIGGPGCVEDLWTPPRSINIRGARIAVTYIEYGLFGTPSVGLVRTTNDFASFSDQTIAGDQDEHLVGYVSAEGTVKLAAAFDTGDRIRFRRQE